MAKKRSGKTSNVHKIIKHCANKSTYVHIFCPTVERDIAYTDVIVPYLEAKGISYTTHMDLGSLPSVLDELQHANIDPPPEHPTEAATASCEPGTASLHTEAGTASTASTASNNQRCREYLRVDTITDETTGVDVETTDAEKPKRARKPRKTAPENLFIFDDLGAALRNPTFNTLLKQQRHYKCKIVICSHWLNDLSPEARRQIDYWLLYPGHSLEKLTEAYPFMDLTVDVNTFLRLYRSATNDAYNFLYVDTTRGEFRKNYDQRYNIRM